MIAAIETYFVKRFGMNVDQVSVEFVHCLNMGFAECALFPELSLNR